MYHYFTFKIINHVYVMIKGKDYVSIVYDVTWTNWHLNIASSINVTETRLIYRLVNSKNFCKQNNFREILICFVSNSWIPKKSNSFIIILFLVKLNMKCNYWYFVIHEVSPLYINLYNVTWIWIYLKCRLTI